MLLDALAPLALVDFEVRRFAALDDEDPRAFHVTVAGPAALLFAKLHEIAERVGTNRAEDEDALDVLRLPRGGETQHSGSSWWR